MLTRAERRESVRRKLDYGHVSVRTFGRRRFKRPGLNVRDTRIVSVQVAEPRRYVWKMFGPARTTAATTRYRRAAPC